jgi:Protein of unknown function (DUF1549)/Protein of unknown function (DUF1553)
MTRNGSQPRGWRRVAVFTVAAATSTALLAAAQPDGCPVPHVSAAVALQLAIHDASVRAETAAPSVSANAVSTGKHRAVRPPSKSFTNPIDLAVFAKMGKDGITPTTRSNDAEFLRRVTLDLTGQLPDPATITAFLADTTADKRTRTIDGLLASDAFNDRWTMWFGDLVQNVQAATNIREYYVGRNTYYSWIRASIQQGKPYDQLVRELISGQGDSFATGNANYVVRQLQPNGPGQDTFDNLAAHAGEKFLGMPFLCISCHNGVAHLESVNTYLARKTRLDFWKAAAFFARTTARADLAPEYGANIRKYTVAQNMAAGYLLNTKGGNKTDRVPPVGQGNTVTPAFLFTGEQPRVGEMWRDAYGRILTADPQFARATVNYLWKEMFGLGIIEPDNNIDPFRLDPNSLAAGQTVQPINPDLLVALTTNFQQGGYSLRSLLRLMVTSDTYQLSSRYTVGIWNEAWTTYFARHYPRRLTSEEIADAVAKATSVPMTMNVNGMGAMSKAMSLPDPTEPNARSAMGLFLNSFGRGNRDDVMRSEDSSITQALSMMNDPTVTSRIKQGANGGNSTVGKALKASTDPAAITDTLYMATLSRHPTAAESAAAVTYLKSGTLAQKTEDLQYVLLNQLEFLFD